MDTQWMYCIIYYVCIHIYISRYIHIHVYTYIYIHVHMCIGYITIVFVLIVAFFMMTMIIVALYIEICHILILKPVIKEFQANSAVQLQVPCST